MLLVFVFLWFCKNGCRWCCLGVIINIVSCGWGKKRRVCVFVFIIGFRVVIVLVLDIYRFRCIKWFNLCGKIYCKIIIERCGIVDIKIKFGLC